MERPILFNTEMVQAILQGRKTSTRRILKHDKNRPYWMGDFVDGTVVGRKKGTIWTGFYEESDIFYMGKEKQIDGTYTKQPYQVGDILWVRETWRKQPVGEDGHIEIQYKADFSKEELACYGRRGGYAPCKWHPSIHMRKSIARLYLKVTNVRVQQIQDITHEEILKEGTKVIKSGYERDDYKFCFAALWNLTCSKDEYKWDVNPWVWVIEFQKFNKE